MKFWGGHDKTPEPMRARFEPEKDITTHELAFIYSKIMLQPILFPYGRWEKIPANIQRHFK